MIFLVAGSLASSGRKDNAGRDRDCFSGIAPAMPGECQVRRGGSRKVFEKMDSGQLALLTMGSPPLAGKLQWALASSVVIPCRVALR